MMLAHLRGGYLFEVLPDRFPWGRLTDLEIALWAKFYDENERRK